ncbi:MAG: hypothetical protein BGO31_05735 [Bacteroidetes bacterium 43-16]|nr:MAG: hypothetical protein BGO31_05735 [Bacteroidetes bacterium 43-16]
MIFSLIFWGVLIFSIARSSYRFIQRSMKIRRAIVVEGVVVHIDKNVIFDEDEPLTYTLTSKFEFEGREMLIEEKIEEKLFKHQAGKPIKIYVDQDFPPDSVTQGNFSKKDFIAMFVKDYLIIVLLLIFKAIIYLYEK